MLQLDVFPQSWLGECEWERNAHRTVNEILDTLLRQVVFGVLFTSGCGNIMDSRGSLASPSMTPQVLELKLSRRDSAQAGFNLLNDRHRAVDCESVTLRGGSEAYDLRLQLLDAWH